MRRKFIKASDLRLFKIPSGFGKMRANRLFEISRIPNRSANILKSSRWGRRAI